MDKSRPSVGLIRTVIERIIGHRLFPVGASLARTLVDEQGRARGKPSSETRLLPVRAPSQRCNCAIIAKWSTVGDWRWLGVRYMPARTPRGLRSAPPLALRSKIWSGVRMSASLMFEARGSRIETCHADTSC
jgi:hypothetical protein